MIGKNVVVVVGVTWGVTCRQGVRRQRINNRERFEESPNGGSNPLTSTSQAPSFGAFLIKKGAL